MTKPAAVSGTCVTAPRMAHATRAPVWSWMIIVRPATSADSPPVSTLSVPLLEPSAADVYEIDVHGSDVTAPA